MLMAGVIEVLLQYSLSKKVGAQCRLLKTIVHVM